MVFSSRKFGLLTSNTREGACSPRASAHLKGPSEEHGGHRSVVSFAGSRDTGLTALHPQPCRSSLVLPEHRPPPSYTARAPRPTPPLRPSHLSPTHLRKLLEGRGPVSLPPGCPTAWSTELCTGIEEHGEGKLNVVIRSFIPPSRIIARAPQMLQALF